MNRTTYGWVLRSFGVACSAALALVLAACNGGSTPSVPTAELPNAAQGAQLISTSPAMSPAFDPAIHDYVVACQPDVPVQLKGYFTSSAAAGYSQQSFALKAGQRFRFFVGSDTEEYSVRCLPSDFPPLTVSVTGTGTPQAQWYLFAPNLTQSVSGYGQYAIVTDVRGTPVWWYKDLAGAENAEFFGAQWLGWSTGSGGFIIRNYAGFPTTTLSGNLDGHDLQQTPSGTYLTIEYVPRACPTDCADLSPWGGSAQAAVVDGEIHEIDANSNILWKWRTRDHIALSETALTGWLPLIGDDIIHLNSVQPDGDSGVIFSARYLNAIYRIDKSTGAVSWKLGGTPRAESLTLVGDTRPTAIGVQALSGQHDARLWPDGTVSVHDNGTIATRPPYIMRYVIDTTNATATVVEAIVDARVSYSPFTGSARRTLNGNWLAQWGGLPFMTELDSQGNPLLTINYNIGSGFSYRAVPALPGEVAATTLRGGMDTLNDQ